MNIIIIILYLLLAEIAFHLLLKRFKINHILEIVFRVCLGIVIYYAIIAVDHRIDNFFFEVSEGRKKCLEEQVEPVFNRTKGCCGKEMRQGIPVNRTYRDLINPDNTWNRVDAFGVEDSMTPPTQTCNDPSIGY